MRRLGRCQRLSRLAKGWTSDEHHLEQGKFVIGTFATNSIFLPSYVFFSTGHNRMQGNGIQCLAFPVSHPSVALVLLFHIPFIAVPNSPVCY
jgi:hypothetical protein